MSLGELLEELREGILHDFSDQIAGDSDQLWPNRRLVRYINEAERRFARESLCLRDGKTPEVTHIHTKAFQKEYELHSSIVGVLSARCMGSAEFNMPDDIADLARAGHSQFQTYHVPDTYFFDPGSLSTLRPGKMVAFDTDEYVSQDDAGTMSRMNMRVYPAPDPVHIQPIHLRVVRLPLNRLTLGDLEAIPEIPEDHHLEMLDWAAYLALRIVDLDEGSPDRANEFRESFEAHTLEAKKNFMRKMFTPMQWSFGRNGFSWESN